MKLRTDVVHEVVNGRHVFVSLRTAWDECPFIFQTSPRSGLIWDCIKEGCTKESCIDQLQEKFSMKGPDAARLYDNFIRAAVRLHYMKAGEDDDD